MPVGDEYVYSHPDSKGFGESVRGGALTAEMDELDLKDSTGVVFLAEDEDSGWPIVEWTDGTGINRITTIDPDLFEQFFKARKS